MWRTQLPPIFSASWHIALLSGEARVLGSTLQGAAKTQLPWHLVFSMHSIRFPYTGMRNVRAGVWPPVWAQGALLFLFVISYIDVLHVSKP